MSREKYSELLDEYFSFKDIGFDFGTIVLVDQASTSS
jgi:hypothetical protein